MGVNYHIVSNKDLDYVKHLFSYKNEEEFRKDLDLLRKNFNLISYKDYINNNAPSNSILLSFDDGYKELNSIILPILEEFNIPALYFITTDLIDNQNTFYRNKVSICMERVLNSDQEELKKVISFFHERQINLSSREEIAKYLRSTTYKDLSLINEFVSFLGINAGEIASNGEYYLSTKEIVDLHNHPLITIGAHTIDHRELYLLDSPKEIIRQIVQSCEIIKGITNQRNVPFAFPYTSERVDRSILNSIKAEHKWIGDLFGECDLSKDSDLVIKRFAGEGTSSKNIFQSIKNEYVMHFKHLLKSLLSG